VTLHEDVREMQATVRSLAAQAEANRLSIARHDEQVTAQRARLETIDGDARAAREKAEEILVQIAVMRTKVAIWAGAGSLIGAGVISAIVALITRGLG